MRKTLTVIAFIANSCFAKDHVTISINSGVGISTSITPKISDYKSKPCLGIAAGVKALYSVNKLSFGVSYNVYDINEKTHIEYIDKNGNSVKLKSSTLQVFKPMKVASITSQYAINDSYIGAGIGKVFSNSTLIKDASSLVYNVYYGRKFKLKSNLYFGGQLDIVYATYNTNVGNLSQFYFPLSAFISTSF